MAASLHVTVLVGSLRAESVNRRLAMALTRMLESKAQCSFIDIGALPHYTEDDESHPVRVVEDFRAACVSADAFLIVTPEYNRSVPGVLKNAIDQGSRPKGASIWKGKPAAVIGASPGVLGSCMAQQHLRNVRPRSMCRSWAIQRPTSMPSRASFLTHGSITDESVARFLQGWCDAFVKWMHLFHPQAR